MARTRRWCGSNDMLGPRRAVPIPGVVQERAALTTEQDDLAARWIVAHRMIRTSRRGCGHGLQRPRRPGPLPCVGESIVAAASNRLDRTAAEHHDPAAGFVK